MILGSWQLVKYCWHRKHTCSDSSIALVGSPFTFPGTGELPSGLGFLAGEGLGRGGVDSLRMLNTESIKASSSSMSPAMEEDAP